MLAAGQKIEQDREGKPQTVPVITLLVTPDDAARLTMASTEGKIQLALRNTVDTKADGPARGAAGVVVFRRSAGPQALDGRQVCSASAVTLRS